jgi:hypothetical protein
MHSYTDVIVSSRIRTADVERRGHVAKREGGCPKCPGGPHGCERQGEETAVGTRIAVTAGGWSGAGELFDELAPLTTAAFRNALPITDRTIQVRWSGDAWRTEKNYELRPAGSEVENLAGRLEAGDIIYYPNYKSGNVKIGFAYGPAEWLMPFRVPVDVCRVGRLTSGVDEFVAVCQRIIFDGPVPITITAG